MLACSTIFQIPIETEGHSGDVLTSYWASKVPNIDGYIDVDEWTDANKHHIHFYSDDSGYLETYIFVKNDADSLYLLIDAVGDQYAIVNSSRWLDLYLDADHSESLTAWTDKEYLYLTKWYPEKRDAPVLEFIWNGTHWDATRVFYWNGYSFSSSPDLSTPHWIYEFELPLEMFRENTIGLAFSLILLQDGHGYAFYDWSHYYDYMNPNTWADLQFAEGIPPDLTVFKPEINDLVVAINGVVLPRTPGTTTERIHWDWGDGYSEDHWFAALHTYADYGDYTITVTAYQSDGLNATETKQVSLNPPDVGPTILILVDEDIYLNIKANLTIFEEDLRNEGYEILKRTVTSETSPPEIKNIIKSCCLQHDLIGTILVGNIKAAYMEIRTGPMESVYISLDASDMYYMDLDGEWEHVTDPDFCEDKPPYVSNCYKYPSCETFKNEYIVYPESEEKEWNYSEIENQEQFKAEIWVSRIMAHNLDVPGKSEAQTINDFLFWDHNFRTGAFEVSSKAYLLAAWEESGPCPYQCMDYSSIFDEVITMDCVTKEDFLACLGDGEGGKLMYLGAHSWPQGHALYDTSVTTDDLVEKNKTSIFYILNACSSCRWDHSTSSPEDPNYLGGLYVFDTSPDHSNYGLGAIGFTGVGGFNWLQYFTDYLNDNPDSTYGEAYKFWFNSMLVGFMNCWPPGALNYVYLGDPTIGPYTGEPRARPTASADLILPNPAVEGETVYFEGHGNDPDGYIVDYWWESSIDGNLSDQSSFSTSKLSVGWHEIIFKVKDNDGLWSDPAQETLRVGIRPNLVVFDPEISELTVTVNGVVLPGTNDTYIERLHWDWGDGYEEDHWFLPSHTYSDYGTYTITVTAYQSDDLTATETKTIHALTIQLSTGGTTDPSAGSYFQNEGDETYVTAYPDDGYEFDHWIKDYSDAGNDNPILVVMDNSHTLKPTFKEVAKGELDIKFYSDKCTLKHENTEATITLEIENIGNADARDVQLDVEVPDHFETDDTTHFEWTVLTRGDKKTMNITVTAERCKTGTFVLEGSYIDADDSAVPMYEDFRILLRDFIVTKYDPAYVKFSLSTDYVSKLKDNSWYALPFASELWVIIMKMDLSLSEPDFQMLLSHAWELYEILETLWETGTLPAEVLWDIFDIMVGLGLNTIGLWIDCCVMDKVNEDRTLDYHSMWPLRAAKGLGMDIVNILLDAIREEVETHPINSNFLYFVDKQGELDLLVFTEGKNLTVTWTGNKALAITDSEITELTIVVDAESASESVEEYDMVLVTFRENEIVDYEELMSTVIEIGEQQKFNVELDQNGEIIAIPEFSQSLTLLLILMFATLVAFIVKITQGHGRKDKL